MKILQEVLVDFIPSKLFDLKNGMPFSDLLLVFLRLISSSFYCLLVEIIC